MKHHRRPLTAQEVENLRKRIIEARTRLWEDVRETLLHQLGEDYQDRILTIRDEEDLAQADLQEDIVIEAMKARKTELEAISQALWRMDRMEYGKCLDCGRWIELERLEARPWASYCLACKEKLEREGKDRS